MLMVIDVGNTNMVFGLFSGKQLIGSFRLMTDTNRTSDEIGLTTCEYFRRFDLDTEEVEAVIIASVVPQVMYTLTNSIVKYFSVAPVVVDDDIDPGIEYESEERLGADRAVACVAAMEKYGRPLIVMDFGTATTIDALSHRGVYLGGSISVGMRVSTEALVRNTAMLPRVELVKPPRVLGLNTVEQIQAGAVMGYIGTMEYLLRLSKEEMGYGDGVRVIATGGIARMIAQNSDIIDVVDNQLILDGLRMIYERYVSQTAQSGG